MQAYKFTCPSCGEDARIESLPTTPIFILSKGNFVLGSKPTWHVLMDLDGTRFRLDNEFTAREVKTHFNLDVNLDVPLDEFTKAYIDAALWSSTDSNGSDSDDTPLDENYSESDLSAGCLKQMQDDCRTFQSEYGHLWENATTGRREWGIDAQAGHDFWLTRNGHGAGFWDPEIYGDKSAEKLTKAANNFGEVCLYVGDGKIHAS